MHIANDSGGHDAVVGGLTDVGQIPAVVDKAALELPQWKLGGSQAVSARISIYTIEHASVSHL